jgi:hypothetical protein
MMLGESAIVNGGAKQCYKWSLRWPWHYGCSSRIEQMRTILKTSTLPKQPLDALDDVTIDLGEFG